MTALEQMKAKAREKLKPQLTNTRNVKPEVVDFARLLLADFWQAQQKDLDEIIEATYHARTQEVKDGIAAAIRADLCKEGDGRENGGWQNAGMLRAIDTVRKYGTLSPEVKYDSIS